MTWAELDKLVYKYECDHPAHRITRIYFDGDNAPEHYVGRSSECGLSHGAPGVRLSSGEIVQF